MRKRYIEWPAGVKFVQHGGIWFYDTHRDTKAWMTRTEATWLKFKHELDKSVHENYEKSDNLAIDVGANVGLWSLLLRDSYVNIMAFEPYPPALACLGMNLKWFNDVEIHPYGLSHVEHSIDLVLNSGGSAFCHSIPGSHATAKRLDDHELDGVGLIKIDTDGTEGDVLVG